ncbi:PEP-CTERM sorting domain-containing protein [Microcystis sp. M061S2]|uniref:PEP-CTERM sorting domain-containing protein n=1 Tax=Microcystis sp. M061S2 TaxID=2771171 RepID=UPI0025844CB4|nr:PEP-CTERM sorting domain-containing protein [Microcystis sp. M061S2]MCA2655808.1 PEP-CTERM sorting domain-containing protein [Microcystis sp. M061S2]
MKLQLGILSGVALAATLGTAGAAQAAIVVVPPGLNPGDQYRLVFVTDGTRDATSTNINDYNTFVTNDVTPTSALAIALNAAGLTTTWKAIGSTASVAARDNTGTNPSSTGVPIYLIDGNLVANDNADLWDGQVSSKLNLTPSNTYLGFNFVWTGTSSDGTGGLGGAYFLGSGLALVGQTDQTFGWVFSSDQQASSSLRLYGLSSILTVPTPPAPVSVPEPSSLLGYITLGGLMLGGAVRKARK